MTKQEGNMSSEAGQPNIKANRDFGIGYHYYQPNYTDLGPGKTPICAVCLETMSSGKHIVTPVRRST